MGNLCRVPVLPEISLSGPPGGTKVSSASRVSASASDFTHIPNRYMRPVKREKRDAWEKWEK